MLFLEDRRIIEISEFEDFEQIKNFFQSIITNDIRLIKEGSKNSISTLLLNSPGRFLFDCFLIIPSEFQNKKIFLDVHEAFEEKIILHIKKYKMRLSFKIFARDDLGVFSNLDGKDENMKKVFEFQDDRAVGGKMGKRIVVLKQNNMGGDLRIYNQKRLENLMVDGFYDLESEVSLPINYNLYSQNSISLQKGCYIGQETTNRLFRTSVLRKSIFLIKIENNEFSARIQKNDPIFCKLQNGELHKIGSFISFYTELGLAFCFFEKPEFENDSEEKKKLLEKIFSKNSSKIFISDEKKQFEILILEFLNS